MRRVVNNNKIKASIKFQFRNVKEFIHPKYYFDKDIRYVDKTRRTEISWQSMGEMIKEVSQQGMLTMATPFDEYSVEKCVDFDLDIIKIASPVMLKIKT